MFFLEILKAILLGIIEGVTEWLPVSSTGHMILADEFISLGISPEFRELFLVVIQLGAIIAVAVVFFSRLNPFAPSKSKQERSATLTLWAKVIVGALPAAFVGLLLDDLLDKYFYNYIVVAVALILYGVAFIVVEKVRAGKGTADSFRVNTVEELTYRDALTIGAFQVLSLIPGTSRSGSTMLGGILSGVSRTASAEFSFFMALPIMLGASGLKVVKFLAEGYTATPQELILLAVGIIVSFLVSLVVIRFLMDFVKRHTFSSFGYYRIALGVIVLVYFLVSSN